MRRSKTGSRTPLPAAPTSQNPPPSKDRTIRAPMAQGLNQFFHMTQV